MAFTSLMKEKHLILYHTDQWEIEKEDIDVIILCSTSSFIGTQLSWFSISTRKIYRSIKYCSQGC